MSNSLIDHNVFVSCWNHLKLILWVHLDGLKRGLLSKFHFSTRMRVCWILIGRFWNCRNFLKNDPNNIKLILVVYHWNVFWMVSKVILYRTHVHVYARALLFRHFSDTKMAITLELKTEINSNFYCRFMTWVPKEWCQEKFLYQIRVRVNARAL